MLDQDLLKELRNRAVREARIMHDYIQVEFLDGTVLNLNNDVELDGWSVPYTDQPQLPLLSLAGCVVLEVGLTADCFKLTLSGDHFLTMTLKPEAWRSPEALALYVPGEPPVVFTEP
jgi:hypothetical protein